MLVKLRNAQQTAITEAWFDNLTDIIFRVEEEKQVCEEKKISQRLILVSFDCTDV